MILTGAHVLAFNLPAGDQVSNPVKKIKIKIGHTKYHVEKPKPLGEVLHFPMLQGSTLLFKFCLTYCAIACVHIILIESIYVYPVTL